jgi:anaerobic dimethyl sulfoxide reductase subunit B
MAQYGFFFDQSRCSGCRACTIACKSWNGLPSGPLKFLKVYEYEKGSFPETRIHFQWINCYHCEEPICVTSCPFEAIYKEEKYGTVLIDSEKCTGCRLCYDSCPYGAPVFESDASGVKAQKCNMCFNRLELDMKPVCVLSCPNRALDFGPLDNLGIRYGNQRDLEDLPSSITTKPAILFKPHTVKRHLVPYNIERALLVMKERSVLPPVFNSSTDITKIPQGMIGRNELVIKHKLAADLLRHTRNDEG